MKKETLDQAQSDEIRLQELERESRDASLAGRTDVFEKIAADEFLCINSKGVRNKSQALKSRRAREMEFKSLQIEDERIHVHDGWAIVTGISRVRGVYEGKKCSGIYRYTRIYAKRNGGWRLFLSQSTRLFPRDKHTTLGAEVL